MFAFTLFLLAAALVYFAWDLRRVAARKAEETGVGGSVLYSDADHERPTEPLACELPDGGRLVGKPDYLLKRDGKIIPLEYKSNRAPERLFPSHEEQVGAYFILIESRFGPGAVPDYGLVRFGDGKEFSVENSARLRERVLAHAKMMRAIETGGVEARRNHESRAKCAACEFFPVCDERIA